MSIIFMGTPDFAVASLKALLDAGEKVVAVVTAPDKPAGRGQKLHQSAVKRYAQEQSLAIMQPTNLKDPDFLSELKSYQAELQIVVAFRMLPEVVWSMPKKGTINLHASLLPQYRGAAPINHAIINGEKESGVTTFLLQHEIDTGNILFSEKVPISNNDTAGDLHDELMKVGAQLLVKTVQAIKQNKIEGTPQQTDKETLKSAPKIHKDDCKINWAQSAKNLHNFIRGLSPYPTAYTRLNGKILKIFKASPIYEKPDIAVGDYKSDGKSFLRYACTDGYIDVEVLQIEGKKRMSVTDFLRGYQIGQ
ncbi:methionyl-tRNA formyltransferase [Albibacterium indicum]|uniref:methionyl-tRNA formyltransferase n=1 Tax=Albibacterium indicum TaxID=2292082 RepID=UPI000E46874F|nr:methionyl-tRNA formyltransferase [Pedobacter indicus]